MISIDQFVKRKISLMLGEWNLRTQINQLSTNVILMYS